VQTLPIACDIRSEEDIGRAIAEIVSKLQGIDIVVNNASAIHLAPLTGTSSKRFDLMWGINVRGSFLLTTKCLPHLLQSKRTPHVLFMSPPLHLQHADWFSDKVAYTASKYCMSMFALGMSRELQVRPSIFPTCT
jgi:citronellol/citronellal dehydrogenase